MEKQPSTLWYMIGSAVAVTVGAIAMGFVWNAVSAARASNTTTTTPTA